MKIAIKRWQGLNWLLIGWILSIFLVLINYQRWFIVILSYLVAYFVLSGLNKNINLILSFTKKHKLLHIYFGILIVSSIYNAYDLNSAFIGVLRVFTMYSLVLFGYLIASKSTESSYMLKGILIAIIISLFFGIYQGVVGYNPLGGISDIVTQSVTRISSWYAHPIPCSCFFIVGVVLGNMLIDNLFFKVLLLMGMIYGIVLTQSRSAWLILIILFIVALVCNLVSGKFKHYISRKKMLYLLFICLLIGLIFVVMYGKISELYLVIMDRLFSKSTSEDMSYTWRLMVIRLFTSNASFLDLHTYFGHGYNSASNLLANSVISSKFTYNVATTDNAYISIFYDFGIFGFIGFAWIVFYSIKNIFKQRNVKRQYPYYITLVIMLFSFFFDAPYWISVGFLFAFFYGIGVSFNEYEKTQNKGDD